MVRNIASVFTVVEEHFAVDGVNGESQRVVVQTTVLHFFRDLAHAFGGADLVQIHRQQPFSKQHLLGIEQLVELVGRLLPGDQAGGKPGRQREQQEEKRQAQLQAQALRQFHALPRV